MNLPTRSEIPTKYTWNLEVFYRSCAVWEEEFSRIESALGSIDRFRGRLGESSAVLAEALERFVALSRAVEKLYTFSHLLSDTDTTSSENLGLLERAQNLYTRFAASVSFLNPELIAIPAAQLDRLLSDETLKPYTRLVRDIVRYRDHTLSPPEENLLAQATDVFTASEKIFSQLNNADFAFDPVTVDGQSRPLTHGSFVVLLKNPNREVRRTAYEQYYDVFAKHRHSLAAALGSAIKADVYLALVRRYPSALQQGLFGDNVMPEVYENLIATVHRHLEPLHLYHGCRRSILQVEQLELYDTYVSLVPEIVTHFSYEEACEHLREAFRPLGEDYVSRLSRGLTVERWVDVLENKGKRSGAYSSGCYDSYPYILMNYKEDNLSDLFTLAHEAGHSMHRLLSAESQSYQDHHFTIFVAEVASTFNEQLLLAHLRRIYAADRAMLRFLANYQAEEIKRTLYRQTMFAEFEQLTHSLAEENAPLTVDSLCGVYRELLARYSGPQLHLNEVAPLECLRIPHFYSAFYVYKYATGLAAAIALAQQVLRGGTAERDRYLRFLSAGCTRYPLELLADAGVDMRSPRPIEIALERFGGIVAELGSG